MGYYDVLEEISRLSDNKVSTITIHEIKLNLDVSERAISRSIKKLIHDNKIERVMIKNGKGTIAYYKIKNNKTTEKIINDCLTKLARLIH